MNNPQSTIGCPRSKVVIAGAGPAGASLAIRLAMSGIQTSLIERERFPRQKLCGEFISPECLKHFEQLGVMEEMLGAGGDRIVETRFFESGGRSVAVPTEWFGQGSFALSLSRAEMDNQLLNRAKEVGVAVFEETSITDVESLGGRVVSIQTRDSHGNIANIEADLFVDATGRSRVLSKLFEKRQDIAAPRVKPGLVGFKTHLRDVDLANGLCEIYSFKGGYAGLSHVEGGLFNLCFLIEAATVRSIGSDAAELVKQVVTKNKRAAATLREASATSDWLAVSIDSFGKKEASTATNLFTVGDAAAFIDPFTGSGMVMAFESAGVLAEAILANPGSSEQIAKDYRAAYKKKFANRLRVCSILRRTAFMPNLATAIVTLLGISTNARRRLARATRGRNSELF
jgi:flavin-dependent dehydrogenase